MGICVSKQRCLYLGGFNSDSVQIQDFTIGEINSAKSMQKISYIFRRGQRYIIKNFRSTKLTKLRHDDKDYVRQKCCPLFYCKIQAKIGQYWRHFSLLTKFFQSLWVLVVNTYSFKGNSLQISKISNYIKTAKVQDC